MSKSLSTSLSTLRLEGSPAQSRISPSIQRILRLRLSRREWLKSTPEPGLVCLICSQFDRQPTEKVSRTYRGTSLIRNTPLLGTCSRTIPRVLWWSSGGGLFLMSKVPLCGASCSNGNGGPFSYVVVHPGGSKGREPSGKVVHILESGPLCGTPHFARPVHLFSWHSSTVTLHNTKTSYKPPGQNSLLRTRCRVKTAHIRLSSLGFQVKILKFFQGRAKMAHIRLSSLGFKVQILKTF